MNQVWAISQFEYEQWKAGYSCGPLPAWDLGGVRCIRIFNVSNIDFVGAMDSNELAIFFDDIKVRQLKLFEKIVLRLGISNLPIIKKLVPTHAMTCAHALAIKSFLKDSTVPVVIHCEYGKSRSVGVALWMRSKMGYKFENANEKDVSVANDWVQYLLE